MTSSTAERRVVVGVDGSQPSRHALQWAQFMARTLNAEIDAVAVWDIPAAMAAMAEAWVDDRDPEKETAANLHTTLEEVLGSQPLVPVREMFAAAAPPASSYKPVKAHSYWSSAAAATAVSPGSCWDQSAQPAQNTPTARCSSSTATPLPHRQYHGNPRGLFKALVSSADGEAGKHRALPAFGRPGSHFAHPVTILLSDMGCFAGPESVQSGRVVLL